MSRIIAFARQGSEGGEGTDASLFCGIERNAMQALQEPQP